MDRDFCTGGATHGWGLWPESVVHSILYLCEFLNAESPCQGVLTGANFPNVLDASACLIQICATDTNWRCFRLLSSSVSKDSMRTSLFCFGIHGTRVGQHDIN